MPAYTTVVTHATGDVLPATDWNSYLRDNLAFIHDMGADLASAATLTPTNQFHRVTGTTTITAIATPTGTGQGGNRCLLYFQSAGCSITQGAALITQGAFTSFAGQVIEFIWDSTAAAWVETGRSGTPGTQIDYQQITATTAAIVPTTEGTSTSVITGNSVTYSGARIKIEYWCPGYTATGNGTVTYVIYKDSTVVYQVSANIRAGAADVWSPTKVETFDTPGAGTHQYKVFAFANAASTFQVVAGLGGSGNKPAAWMRTTVA